MHGYEMMKALQERSGGMYTPSAGSVYPTLQLLEDRGFVTSSDAEGKKVYAITEAGRSFLQEGRPEEGSDRGRHGFWGGPHEDWAPVAALMHELRTLGPLLSRALQRARREPEARRQLRELIGRVRGDLAKIAGDADEFDM